MVTPIVVHHALGSYPVIVEVGALSGLASLVDEQHPRARPVVVADAQALAAVGSPLPAAPSFTFPSGEASKTRDTWAALTDRLLAERCDRNTLIVAVGGGVATDLAGFVAATFLRGVPWIAVPTTTLGMLDAAIGGKTGVDTDAGKNLVGAFHPPAAVLSDPATLRTLPERNFREGLAEAVKHAATLDASLGEWMLANAAAIGARDMEILTALVERSAAIKAAVVSGDEREGNRRAVLNAGHTVAHALERATDYAIAHGEAVAIGLVIETRVAETMGIAESGTAARVVTLLERLGLPVTPPAGIDRARFRAAMYADKKNRAGTVHASLVAYFGRIEPVGDLWTREIDAAVVEKALGV